jgi:hypothetical protein
MRNPCLPPRPADPMNLISFGLEYEAKPLSHRNHLCAERRIGPVKRRRLREPPRSLEQRQNTRFQSPCRHFGSNLPSHFSDMPTYLANRDARVRLTKVESVNYERVHRLARYVGINQPCGADQPGPSAAQTWLEDLYTRFDPPASRGTAE